MAKSLSSIFFKVLSVGTVILQKLQTTVTQNTPSTKDVNWTYIRRSEDVQDTFCTSCVRSICALCPGGLENCILIYSKMTKTYLNLLVFLTCIYLFKVNNGNTRAMCEICQKNIKDTRTSITSSGGFIVTFEHISHLFLGFLLSTLNK